MLSKLISKNVKNRKIYITMDNVQSVLDEAKGRIKAHETEALVNGRTERAHAYNLALTELLGVYNEMMLKQLQED